MLASHGFLPLPDSLLHQLLNIHVYGGHDDAAVSGRLDHRLQVGIIIEISVLPPVYPDEGVVIILLNPSVSLASVGGGEPDDIACQGAVWVKPLVFILKPYPPNPLVLPLFIVFLIEGILQGFKSLFLLVSHPPLIPEIPGLPVIVHGFQKLVAAVAEYLRQGVDRGVQIVLFLLVDLARVQYQVVNLVAGGQVSPVPVHNIPSSVGDGPAVIGGALGQHHPGIVFIVLVHDLVEHHDQCKQSQHNHENRDSQLFLHILRKHLLAGRVLPRPLLPPMSISSSGCLHTVLHTRFLSVDIRESDLCPRRPCPALPWQLYKCTPSPLMC